MIKIGVDGQVLQGKLAGVGKYTLLLIQYLCEQTSDIHFIIYTNRPIRNDFDQTRVVVIEDKSLLGKIKPMVWYKFFAFRFINRNGLDYFFAGNVFIPFFLRGVKTISVVHDFNFLLVPETVSKLHLITQKLFFKTDVLRSSFVFSNSFATAKKLESWYNRKVDLVIYHKIEDFFKPMNKETVNEWLKKENINYPYLLSVATREPRKNLDKTVAAFITLKQKGHLQQHKLVLVGSKGWKSEQLQEILDSNKNNIVQLGYVSDGALPYLYNGTDAFIFPSRYEGFGTPPREALLCGAPVIVSDIEELRESTFNAATYVDPNNADQLEQAILSVVSMGKTLQQKQQINKDQLPELIPFLLQH